jgi:hypothetical protein
MFIPDPSFSCQCQKDSGSRIRIRIKEFKYPGSRGQKGTGSRIHSTVVDDYTSHSLSLEPEKLLVTPEIQLLIYFRSHSRPSSSSANNNTSSNSSNTTVSSSGHHHNSLPTTTTAAVSSTPALNSSGQLGDNSSHHR